MIHDIYPNLDQSQEGFTKPAEVTMVSENAIHVRLQNNGASFNINAELALPIPVEIAEGDQVLVTGSGYETCFIIGLLGKTRQKLTQFTSSNGASAQVHKVTKEAGEEIELLAIKDAQGHLLFEHDAKNNQSKVYTPTGDLSFLAPNGDIKLVSGQNILCESAGALEMNTQHYARLTAGKQSSLTLGEKGLFSDSENLTLKAEHADLRFTQTRYLGEVFNGTVERSKLVAGKLETVAKRIVESAKNVYRKAEQLSQLKSKRVRTIVEKDHVMQSGSVNMTAKDNVRIDGKGIHLG